MKTFLVFACLAAATIIGGPLASNTKTDWPAQAISTDEKQAQEAWQHLRQSGPEGLEELQDRYTKDVAAHRSGSAADPRWKRIAAALDHVGAQYDNYAAGLYWYTDLAQARQAARDSGKPILSLRLLGRLDEDLSCANSRFFRTTLYPSAEINRLLRENFILHWETFRPVPRVTIAFEDGRKLERTITGNSIHYILDAEGRIIDALPGLYSATVFADELNKSREALQQARASGQKDYTAHYVATEERLLTAWTADLKTLGLVPAKSPMTREILERSTDDKKWRQIAGLHERTIRFDPAVRTLIAGKDQDAPSGSFSFPLPGSKAARYPSAEQAAGLAMTKSIVEIPMLSMFNRLTSSIALDTVRNNYLLRTRILGLLRNAGPMSLSDFNDQVYAEVFLTPRYDPWLGLNPNDVFTAIDNNGEVL